MVYTPPNVTSATPGTPVPLSGTLPTSGNTNFQNPRADVVIVQALSTNGGAVVVGGVNPVSPGTANTPGAGPLASSVTGVRLLAGNTFIFPMVSAATLYDLRRMFMDVEVSGNGVSLTYVRR